MDEKDRTLEQLELVCKEVDQLRGQKQRLENRISQLEMEISRCHDFVFQIGITSPDRSQ